MNSEQRRVKHSLRVVVLGKEKFEKLKPFMEKEEVKGLFGTVTEVKYWWRGARVLVDTTITDDIVTIKPKYRQILPFLGGKNE